MLEITGTKIQIHIQITLYTNNFTSNYKYKTQAKCYFSWETKPPSIFNNVQYHLKYLHINTLTFVCFTSF